MTTTAIEFIDALSVDSDADIRRLVVGISPNRKSALVRGDDHGTIRDQGSGPILDHMLEPKTIQPGRLRCLRLCEPAHTKIDLLGVDSIGRIISNDNSDRTNDPTFAVDSLDFRAQAHAFLSIESHR
jgi:hypothetical protein